MFYYDILFSEMWCYLYARHTGTNTFQKFSFCLISPQCFPEGFGDPQDVFWKSLEEPYYHALGWFPIWNSCLQAIFASSLSSGGDMNSDPN